MDRQFAYCMYCNAVEQSSSGSEMVYLEINNFNLWFVNFTGGAGEDRRVWCGL